MAEEKALLGRSQKAENARRTLACALSVPVSPVMFRRPHGRVEVVVNDAETRPGIGVVGCGFVSGRELVFDQFVFDALIGERAGRA